MEKPMVRSKTEKLPLFKTWRSWYLAVFFSLVFYIVVFYIFTRYFN